MQGKCFKTSWRNMPNMHLTNFSHNLVRLHTEALENYKVTITNTKMVDVLVLELYSYKLFEEQDTEN